MSNRFHNKFHRHNHHTAETDRNASYPDSAYDPIASRQSPFKGEFYSEGDITTTKNLCAEGSLFAGGNIQVEGDATVNGNLIVDGVSVTINAEVSSSAPVYITNLTGPGDVYPTINIKNNAESVFYIKGNTMDNLSGFVGIGTETPNRKLTVNGSISSCGDVEVSGVIRVSSIFCNGEPSSNRWNSTYTTVCTTSSRWETAYENINDINDTLTQFKNLSGAINTLNQKFSSSVFTITPDISTVNINKHLSVSNNLSVGGEFFFGNLKVIEIQFTPESCKVLTIPQDGGNDIVVKGSDFTTNFADVSALSFGSAKRGAFYVLTNELSNGVELVFSPNDNIYLRGGANTVSLNLSTGDSCFVRCRDGNGKVSIW